MMQLSHICPVRVVQNRTKLSFHHRAVFHPDNKMPASFQISSVFLPVPAPITENHETLMKDSGIAANARGDIITTVTTEKKAEEEKAEREDARAETTEAGGGGNLTPLRQEAKVNRRHAAGSAP